MQITRELGAYLQYEGVIQARKRGSGGALAEWDDEEARVIV